MPVFQQKQRSSRGRDYDDETPSEDFGGGSEQSQRVSKNASDSLSNIDDALAANQTNPSKTDYENKFNAIPGAERASTKQGQKRYDRDTSDVVGGLKKEENSPEQGGGLAGKAMEGLYKAGGAASGLGAAKKLAGFAGGGLITVILILTIAFMFESFKSKIFAHFLDKFYGAVAHRMLKNRGMVFFDRWVKLDLFPAAKACGNTIDFNCVNQHRGTTPKGMFGRFVAAYRNKKVHDLFVQKGMYFKYEGGNYILTTNLGDSDPVPEGEATSRRIDEVFNSKYDVYDRVFNTLDEHGTMDRKTKRKVAKVLRQQYGARMCLLYCNIAKALEQRNIGLAKRLDNFRNAIVGAIGSRIIDAGIARQVILLDCLTQKIDCSKPEEVKKRLKEINTEDAHRLKNTPAAFDKLMEKGIFFKERKKGLIEKGASLAEMAFERILMKVLAQETAEQVVKFTVRAIPYVGWVIAATELAVLMHDFLVLIHDDDGQHTLRNIWAEMKIAQSVHAFQVVSASGDEAEGVGTAVGGGYDLAATAAMSERLRGIEQAKFYQYNFGSLQGEKEYKAGTPDTGEECRKPFEDEATELPKNDQHFCEEMKLDTDPWIVKALSDENVDAQLPAWAATLFKVLSTVLIFQTGIVKNTIGVIVGLLTGAVDWIVKVLFVDSGLLNVIMTALKAIPIIGPLIDEIAAKAKEIVLGIFNYVLPLIFRDEDEVFGPRLSGAAGIGADFSYNYELGKGGVAEDGEGTPYGLGGRHLTQEESNKMYEQVAQDERTRFQNLSFKDRFFSTDEPSSLFSRLVMANPTGPFSNPQTLVANITNPAANLFGFLGEKLMSGSAYAVPVKKVGIASTGSPQYGHTDDSPLMTSEPSTTEEKDCKDTRTPPTPEAVDEIGRPLYTEGVQCMLDKETVNVWTAPYTDESLGD